MRLATWCPTVIIGQPICWFFLFAPLRNCGHKLARSSMQVTGMCALDGICIRALLCAVVPCLAPSHARVISPWSFVCVCWANPGTPKAAALLYPARTQKNTATAAAAAAGEREKQEAKEQRKGGRESEGTAAASAPLRLHSARTSKMTPNCNIIPTHTHRSLGIWHSCPRSLAPPHLDAQPTLPLSQARICPHFLPSQRSAWSTCGNVPPPT